MPTLVTMKKVRTYFDLTQDSTSLFATDDDADVKVEKYTTADDPLLDLWLEVFAKLTAYLKNQTNVQLAIDSNNYIVRDVTFPIPSATTSITAMRLATPGTTTLDTTQLVGKNAAKANTAKAKKGKQSTKKKSR